jgi:hypothetical protein
MVLTPAEQFVQLAGELHELRSHQKRSDDRLEHIEAMLLKLTARLPPEPAPPPDPPPRKPIPAWEVGRNPNPNACGINANPANPPEPTPRLRPGDSDVTGTTLHPDGTYTIPGTPVGMRYYKDGRPAPRGLPEPRPIGPEHTARHQADGAIIDKMITNFGPKE